MSSLLNQISLTPSDITVLTRSTYDVESQEIIPGENRKGEKAGCKSILSFCEAESAYKALDCVAS